MLIYNTFSKIKEEFIPVNPPNVTFYVCGPTVYDYFHIGNARSFIMADIIRRYLEYKGFNVDFVMNITDIDDKIINKSKENNKSTEEIAKFFTSAFYEDIQKLRIKPAVKNPRATESIQDVIEMIKILEEKGYAYNVDGNVYYDITKFKDYGKLSGKNIEELEAGSRVEVNESKRNPLDFVLWKKAKEGEPSWDSPWGKGRPGWHIECSAMSCKHLGKTIDIHAGGNDLIFPHHENEIAQSEAANEVKFVKYWIHFGFLTIHYEKMSKSLGNFFTAREILSKYSAEAIRLFFAQTHYRGPLNFSEELLSAAEKGVEKIKNLAEKVEMELQKPVTGEISQQFDFKKYYEEFEKVMDDDFNTPQAVAVIFDFVKNVNKLISENEKINSEFYNNVKEFLKDTAENVLGIIHFDSLYENKKSEVIEDKLIELLINVRLALKKEKNYALSDFIRDELNKLGIILQDSKEGTTFKRKK
ncbi:MAG: cysteine--tRNA ligase [Melioribacter sp.]|uniref:cysteine--tRNA ligase n=1 Tax=Rosettibacter primus TaxID=3111523 RepID=UPI00247E9D04|nr:cysteine--tRNA ligase [Melioribacter sp.]